MAHKTYIREPLDADTAVLFIHGFLGSTEHFESFIAKLPQNFAVYNILLSGHGGSVSDFAKASMQQWKAQIEEVVRNLCEKYAKIYIMAHSMGTFFAMESAIRYPDAVKAVFLLQTPLKIGVRATAAVNTFKSFFNIMGEDETAKAYRNAHSVKLNLRLWEYIGWIPRYLELFSEAKKARTTIQTLEADCVIFQSKKDELVSMGSIKHIPHKENITLHILEKSAHFIYSKEDLDFMHDTFIRVLNEKC